MQTEAAEALVKWSLCSEPGDEFAGLMRQAFGAEESMRLICDGNGARIIGAVQDCGFADMAVERFGDLTKVVVDSLERWTPRMTKNSLSTALAMIESGRFHLISQEHQFWPQSLEDLNWAAPAALWVAGSTGTLQDADRSVAMVGSRTATTYGNMVTNDLVSGLAEYEYAIVSGGAYGIDAIAHQAALSLDNPTIAVMAGGLDKLYPSGNQLLLEKIANRWAVVSEMPPGSTPTKWRFLQRNRLIAAMTQVTVVVEAGWRSGSINTANHASSLSRPVAAVPGPISSPASAGCHRLIREGVADLVTCSDDIRELLGHTSATLEFENGNLGPLEKRAKDALTKAWQTLESIAAKAGLTHGEARLALTSLEVAALAEASMRGWRQTGSNL